MSRRQLPPLRRDLIFLAVGGAGFIWNAIITTGPWPTLVICAVVMLGPTAVQLWLLGPGTPDNRGSLPSEPQAPSSPSPSPLPAPPAGETP